jgi:cell filamentation protein, protein adenylyltransferase
VGGAAPHRAYREGRPVVLPAAPDRRHGGDVFGRLAAVHHLRGRDRDAFLDGLTALLAEVNALHPFREGNGRTQRAFLGQLARDAGYRLRWEHVDRDANIDAARAAADGDLAPMRALLDRVVERVRQRR